MKKRILTINRKIPLNYSTINVVPLAYYPYLFDLNYIYSKVDSSVILGRNKEIERIFNCFLRDKKRNAILLGEHGVGKTATLQKLVTNVTKGKCPEELKYHHFVCLDVQNILANIEEKAMIRKLKSIMEFIMKCNNLVVVIDQVHLVQASYLLSYYFSLLVKQSNVCVLGLTTEDEFYDYFEFDVKTRSRLNTILIKEPKPDKVYPMIKNVIKRLEKLHQVTISEDLVKYIICVSGAFSTELALPELVVDIVEKSMIYAKRKHEKKVTKQFINKNFNFDYELYNKMSLEDKKIVAYHEAGHFVVSKLSENIRNYKTTAITIVPGEDFLGITSFQFEPEKQLSCDKQYYIDNIAVDLAGRVAEIILANEHPKRYTSGANSDLQNATNTARAIITEFGMIENFGENMAFLGNYDFSDFSLLSDEIKSQINEETKKLIKMAYDRAEEILKNNIPLLDRIAEELLSNEILDEIDLDRICKEVEEGKALYKKLMEEDL